MQLDNIKMICESFIKICNNWVSQGTQIGVISMQCITSMINAQQYLQKMGGKAENSFRHTKQFGDVVSVIDVTAADGCSRCKYRFNYSEARVVNATY